MPRCDEAERDRPLLLECVTWTQAPPVHKRQMAALYLQAATRADDAAARELLRKRAAGLLTNH